jgi:MFS family permease
MNSMKFNIIKIYVYNFFSSLIFAYVIERLFWESRGMTVLMVVYIEIIYSVIVVVLEVPTGMIADRFSRKTLIMINAVFGLLEFILLIIATNFWYFALAVAISATGHAFQSGAHNALVYDSLKSEGKEASIEKTLGRINAVNYSGIIIGSLLGAVVATTFTLVTTYWISLISLMVALVISFTIVDTKVQSKKEESWNVEDWLTVFKFIFTQANIRFITIIGVFSGGVITFLDEFWQIYAVSIQIPVIFFGMINLLIFGMVAVGSLLSSGFKERLGFKVTLKLMVFLCMLGFAYMTFNQLGFSIIAVMVIYFSSAIMEPLIYGYLHEHAIDKYRATIESAYSMLVHLSVLVIGIPFGYLATEFSIFVAFGYLTCILVLTNVCVLAKKLDK